MPENTTTNEKPVETTLPTANTATVMPAADPVKDTKKKIILTVVIAGVVMFGLSMGLIFVMNSVLSNWNNDSGNANIADNVVATATVTPTPEEDGPPTLTPEETATPQPVDKNNIYFKNAVNSRYQLMGECVVNGDGSINQFYCGLRDNVKNAIVYTFQFNPDYTKTFDDNDPVISIYSMAFLGTESEQGVDIFVYGGEGGEVWGSAYKFNASTGKTVLVGDYSYDAIGFTYMNDAAIRNTPECLTEGSEYKPECRMKVAYKQTADCQDHSKNVAYETACIENFSQISPDSIASILNNHTISKEDAMAEALINKDYGMDYFGYKMRFGLIATADAECQDFRNEKAYTEACFSSVGPFRYGDTAEDFQNATIKMQKIVKLIGYPGYSGKMN